MNNLASFVRPLALAVALVLGAAACGKKNGTLMVDHPIYEYQPPAAVEDDDDQDSGDDDDDSGDDDSGDEATE